MTDHSQAHPDDERTPEQWEEFNAAEQRNNAVRPDDGNPITLEVKNGEHGTKSPEVGA